MASKAKLGLDFEPEFQQVREGLEKLRKLYEKGELNDIEVLSLAHYYSGYISGLRQEWQQALAHFEHARRIDAGLDNTYGVGKALMGIGKCYEKLGFQQKAWGCYQRAEEIFILLNDQAMVRKIKKKISSIEGNG
jgi:tetratricopeptide (TPR) repeat protein